MSSNLIYLLLKKSSGQTHRRLLLLHLVPRPGPRHHQDEHDEDNIISAPVPRFLPFDRGLPISLFALSSFVLPSSAVPSACARCLALLITRRIEK